MLMLKLAENKQFFMKCPAFILCLLFSSTLPAQLETIVPVVKDKNNGKWLALVHLPDDYNTDKKKSFPLLIFLHGAGQSNQLISSIYNKNGTGGPPYFIENGQWPVSFTNPQDGQPYEFIVVSPHAAGTGWSVSGSQLNFIIQDLVRRYRVATNRIYLTGISAGGAGILQYCLHQDDNGNPVEPAKWKPAAIVPMSEAFGVPSQAACAIFANEGIRVWGFGDPLHDIHGENTQTLILRLNKEKPGFGRFSTTHTGHGGWTNQFNPAYKEKITVNGVTSEMNIYEWMLNFTSDKTFFLDNSLGQSPSSEINPSQKVRSAPVAVPSPIADKAKIVNVSFPAGYPPCGSRKKYIPTPGSDSGIYINHSTVHRYEPGDTIVLSASFGWNYFELDNFNGNPGCPLIITNGKGQTQIRKQIKFDGSKYIILQGSGDPSIEYGIRIQYDPLLRYQGYSAIAIRGKSKNIEVTNVFIHNVDIGISCLTNGDCDSSLNYPNWVLDSISIHDNRIVGTWNEGMYLGNTSPDNAINSYDPRPVNCNGSTIYPMPMRNGHMRVYNNYVDSTGRGGIQMASASNGISEIYNNLVMHSGMNGDRSQGTGISVGTYTRVYIHDNKISNTFTWGIASLGGSGTGTVLRIENNKIDSSGYLVHYNLAQTMRTKIDPSTEPVFPDELKWPFSIELGTRPTAFKDSTTFWIRNNIIGKYKNTIAAIQVQDDYKTVTKHGNIICGNKNKSTGTPAKILVSNLISGVQNTMSCSGPVSNIESENKGNLQIKRLMITGALFAIAGTALLYRNYVPKTDKF
jgi:hypothetical protein